MPHRSSAAATSLVATIVALSALVGCGDKPTEAAPSASAAPAPPACEKVARPEQDKRCDAGEAHCCTLLLDATKSSDPSYFDVVAKACGTGHEPACQTVRDAVRDPAWKLETLEKACTRMGRWPCRSATQLALVVAPEQVPKMFDTYCKQSGDSELVLGGATLKCPKVDTNALNQMKPDADACKSGDLAACKALAGVDGAAYDLLSQLAWGARGVAPSTAVDNRVQRDYLGAVVDMTAPKSGKVTVTVDDAGALDKGALAKAVLAERQDLLERCLSWALDHDKATSGDLMLDVLVDKSGRIAYATEGKSTLKTKTDLVECARHRLQDAKIADPRADVSKVALRIGFSR